jgi:hypothetical protein
MAKKKKHKKKLRIPYTPLNLPHEAVDLGHRWLEAYANMRSSSPQPNARIALDNFKKITHEKHLYERANAGLITVRVVHYEVLTQSYCAMGFCEKDPVLEKNIYFVTCSDCLTKKKIQDKARERREAKERARMEKQRKLRPPREPEPRVQLSRPVRRSRGKKQRKR